MKAKTLLLFTLSILFFSKIYGQQIIFKGLVKDTNGKLLQSVIISKKYKNKQAEISNISSGKFALALTDTVNLESISFSCLGYYPSLVKVKDALLFIRNSKNEDFTVGLKSKNVDLTQVVVTDKHPFYQNENASAFDYEIMPNGNLLLVMEKQIFLINQQDSIIRTVRNSMGITQVIKACSGRIFLSSEKLLYPTYIRDTTLLISNNPVEIGSSLKQINELVACDSLIKIKEHVSAHNQKIVYKLQPVSDPLIEVNFYVAQNKEQMNRAIKEKASIDRYDSLAREEKVPTMMTAEVAFGALIGGGSNGKMGTQRIYDELMLYVWPEDQKVWKYEFYTSKKLYAPVFLQRDSIYVFDHAANKITVISYNKIDSNINVNTILKDSITYNKKKGWKQIILQDTYTGEFFTAYRNEKVVLNNILLFENKKQINISFPKDHFYPKRIKIYNHTAYYLWRDLSDATSMWTLYKANAE